jgi:hypothetical protein
MMVKIRYYSLRYVIYEKIDPVMILPFEMVKNWTAPPKSTTNFQQILEGREFTDNLHSPHCTKRIVIYAVNSIIIKRW